MSDSSPRYRAIKEQARAEVEKVSDSPEGRYRMREAFYKKYGGGMLEKYGWGDSELSFLRWEIGRGVLNPLGDTSQPGSPWWRSVNSAFLYNAAVADIAHTESVDPEPADLAVCAWTEFIRKPSASSWYRAHNCSIVHGYASSAAVAVEREHGPERAFMNVVLYRLLYAQSMVMDDSVFGELGRFLADPIGPSVDVLVHIPEFYPDHYPLSEEDIKNIRDRGHTFAGELARIFDRLFVLPLLHRLYKHAAKWNSAPFLPDWARDDCPCYPHR